MAICSRTLAADGTSVASETHHVGSVSVLLVQNKDIRMSTMIDNVSRVKSQLFVITPGGQEWNRLKFLCSRMLKLSDDVNSNKKWVKYNMEIMQQFTVPHLLKIGSICLSPLPSQQNWLDKEEAMKMLVPIIKDRQHHLSNELLNKGGWANFVPEGLHVD